MYLIPLLREWQDIRMYIHITYTTFIIRFCSQNYWSKKGRKWKRNGWKVTASSSGEHTCDEKVVERWRMGGSGTRRKHSYHRMVSHRKKSLKIAQRHTTCSFIAGSSYWRNTTSLINSPLPDAAKYTCHSNPTTIVNLISHADWGSYVLLCLTHSKIYKKIYCIG